MSSLGSWIKRGGFIAIICALRTLGVIRPEKENATRLKKFFTSAPSSKRAPFKDSLELCRCSRQSVCSCAVVISLVPIGSSASREREREREGEREKGGREKRGVREADRLPPWRGSLHNPQWLLSQQTHRCLTGDTLAPYQYSPTFRRVKCLNTKAWNVRLNFLLLRIVLIYLFFFLQNIGFRGPLCRCDWGDKRLNCKTPIIKKKKTFQKKGSVFSLTYLSPNHPKKTKTTYPKKKKQTVLLWRLYAHSHRTWIKRGEGEWGGGECNPSPSICAIPQGQIRGSKPSWENPFFPLTSAAVILCAMTAEQCRWR